MPGPEDLQVSHLDPGHGLHVTCMHSVTGFEVRDLSVFWAGHAQLAYAMQLSYATLQAFERN